jgi:uncharacterized protein YkwD
VSLRRRSVLSAGLATLAIPASAQAPRDSAPSASDVAAWARYAARLDARSVDAGGGRFDPAAANRVLGLANAARDQARVASLAPDPELERAAAAHAADLAARGYVEHLSPEGFDPSHRLWLVGRTLIGSPSENIAFHQGGNAAPADLIAIWRRSPGHWRNLLRPDHSHAGFAVVRRNERAWLVGLFARPLAWLEMPLELRPQPLMLEAALASLPKELHARLAAPQGARAGEGRGVRQISVMRRANPARLDAIGGPIVLLDWNNKPN